MPELFTIGHSNHTPEKFLELLKQHCIEVVGDVRSSPYSAWLPHFNREQLEAFLKRSGIRYVFLGKELGARRDEKECYQNGKATYDKIATLPAFHHGLDRVMQGAAQYKIALMCAEKDPLTCHRTILVCRHLQKRGATINHILEDGSTEPHQAAERRLLKEEKMPEQDLFESADQLLQRAYVARGEKIAFTEGETPGPSTS